MIELAPERFDKIESLYRLEEKCFPLIQAVIKKIQPGWIFTDDPNHPTAALIITRFGFIQVFGSESAQRFDAELADFLNVSHEHMPSYLLWYAPPARWQKKLDALPGQIRWRERMRFIFDAHQADHLQDAVKAPDGFDLLPLDDSLIVKTEVFKLDIGSRFWSSVDDFQKNGIGVCLVKNNEIASLCYAACVVDGLAEVDIVTVEEYRKQGLAVIVAQSFIQECVRRGITPTWDCFVTNTPSVKLAIKLGFAQKYSYNFYSFNIPSNITTAI